MKPERSLDQDIITQDMLWAIIGILLLCLIVVMDKIATTAKVGDGSKSQGEVMVELIWPMDNPSDLDLWVEAPGDVPVGYSNKGGVIFNLLRDDLGDQADLTKRNEEMSYARGIVPGEYTANVHLYRNRGALPLETQVVVSTKPDPMGSARQLLATTATLRKEGEERTALRFSLKADGTLVPGSVSTLFKSLRSGVK